ncbi:hypothetical protein TrCOL_g1149 [Triparma columacea]|uniref:Metallo-beta-lactamase domain-containing protein n=1 Tax=Triparma columacea TaxID=722753 RepID=A0A9W7G9A5_9STRA|nr:hypothetical protein TrCOL_g1149 [Triparma columacea]
MPSSFLPDNVPLPTITYRDEIIALPAGADSAWFDDKGLPMTTQNSSKSKYIVPWDPGVCDKTASDAFKMIKGRLSKKKRRYKEEIPRVAVDIPFPSSDDQSSITWLGHATCVVRLGGKLVLTDPVFSPRCSPFRFMGPKRYTEPGCTIEQLISAGVVFDICVISHDHYDHLDVDSITQLDKGGCVKKWYVPAGTKSVLMGVGVRDEAVKEMVWWEEVTDPSSELKVVCCPAQHWCCRVPWDRNKRLWATWVVKIGDSRFFFGGDTGYPKNFPLFKMIGDLHGPFSLSAIPIGAYHPRWFMAPAHTDPKNAVDIHRDVRSKTSVAIHWGTFPLADELYHEPVTELLEHQAGEDFVALRIGESISSGSKIDCQVHLQRLLESGKKNA